MMNERFILFSFRKSAVGPHRDLLRKKASHWLGADIGRAGHELQRLLQVLRREFLLSVSDVSTFRFMQFLEKFLDEDYVTEVSHQYWSQATPPNSLC